MSNQLLVAEVSDVCLVLMQPLTSDCDLLLLDFISIKGLQNPINCRDFCHFFVMTIRCLLLRQPQRHRDSFSSANDDKKNLRTHTHIVKLSVIFKFTVKVRQTGRTKKRTNTAIVVKDILLDNFNCNILYVSMSSIIHLRGRSNEKDFK